MKKNEQVIKELKYLYKTLECTDVELAWFLGISIPSIKRYYIGAIPQNALTIWAIRFLYKHVANGQITSIEGKDLSTLWGKNYDNYEPPSGQAPGNDCGRCW